MGAPIELTDDEKRLDGRLRALVEELREQARDPSKWRRDQVEEANEKIAEMAKLAHQLHMSLLARDPALEPRHHAYMLRNRGVSPREPDFYDHFHPIEDLLKFIEDRNANEDPPPPKDTTLGKKFIISVFSKRWGHEDIYELVRTSTGWDVQFLGVGGPCNPRGEPYLFKGFLQNDIDYPAALPSHLEALWEAASADGVGLTAEQVQQRLDELAQWVSTTAKAAPKTA
jgi:hypothetical protein